MNSSQLHSQIVSVDRIRDGIIIGFESGESIYYGAAFLYLAQNEKGNRVLPEPTDSSEAMEN